MLKRCRAQSIMAYITYTESHLYCFLHKRYSSSLLRGWIPKNAFPGQACTSIIHCITNSSSPYQLSCLPQSTKHCWTLAFAKSCQKVVVWHMILSTLWCCSWKSCTFLQFLGFQIPESVATSERYVFVNIYGGDTGWLCKINYVLGEIEAMNESTFLNLTRCYYCSKCVLCSWMSLSAELMVNNSLVRFHLVSFGREQVMVTDMWNSLHLSSLWCTAVYVNQSFLVAEIYQHSVTSTTLTW